ncbi:hypothetical protein MKX03_016936 [Papaver bracteatum]|nr:hypothetical protein MKX03_016936 [Papaver bracteatum]
MNKNVGDGVCIFILILESQFQLIMYPVLLIGIIVFLFERKKKTMPSPQAGQGRVPRGVVLSISLFNYNVNLKVSKIAPVLIAGKSLVLKPPTQGALVALCMVHFFHLVGFHKDLVSCITGKGSKIGDFLTMHPGVNYACIVLEDFCIGQRCIAVKFVLVMDSVDDALVEKVSAKVSKLTVGPPEDNCDITSVVSESSANFISKQKGATFEEPFGPVLPVIRINTLEQGIHHCNASNFVLRGCVFTRDINKAILIGNAMETRTVQINSAPARGHDHFPFQGLKDSGIGSQGVTNSILMMTKINSIVINLPTPSYPMG